MINAYSLHRSESKTFRKYQHTSSSHSIHLSCRGCHFSLMETGHHTNIHIYLPRICLWNKRLTYHFKAVPCSLANPKKFTRTCKGESQRICKNKSDKNIQVEVVWVCYNRVKAKYSVFSDLEILRKN